MNTRQQLTGKKKNLHLYPTTIKYVRRVAINLFFDLLQHILVQFYIMLSKETKIQSVGEPHKPTRLSPKYVNTPSLAGAADGSQEHKNH